MTALLDAWLVRFGIQPRPYRALVRAFFLMDLRSQNYGRATGSKPGELIPPLYWVVGQFLFVSTILCASLFMRVSVGAFALANLSMSILLALSAVIVEFNEVVLDIGNDAIVGCRPVAARTQSAARLTNLCFFMLLVTLATNIMPVIVGCGLRDAGPWFAPAYLLACVAGNGAAMFCAIILYSFSPPRRDKSDWRDTLAWTQIILALVVFYGAQMMFRDQSHSVEMFLEVPPPWVQWLPSAWLAAMVKAASTAPSLPLAGAAGAALIGVAWLGFVALRRIAAWRTSIPGHVAAVKAEAVETPARAFIAPWLAGAVRVRQRAAMVALSLRMLRRDHDLRMRTLPVFATTFAVLAMGWLTGELGNPFSSPPNKTIFSILAIQMLLLDVPSVLQNLSYGRDSAAGWLFRVAPLNPAATGTEGLRLTACYAVLLPVLAVLWACFAIAWRAPLDAALHCLLCWLGIVASAHAVLWAQGMPAPFASSAPRGGVLGAVAPYLAGVSVLAIAIGAGEYFTAHSPALFGVTVAVLIALVWLARELTRSARTPTPPRHA